ncbi:peptidyl-prolyl cis-trans isomerase [Xanthomonas citri pv. mangiferaeindicae LMG 941]|nr:peptidyl-prolyl cis-trans isomerase [Xanthomonas citri pv. mangiferaeindicae LMG 941]
MQTSWMHACRSPRRCVGPSNAAPTPQSPIALRTVGPTYITLQSVVVPTHLARAWSWRLCRQADPRLNRKTGCGCMMRCDCLRCACGTSSHRESADAFASIMHHGGFQWKSARVALRPFTTPFPTTTAKCWTAPRPTRR